MKYIVISMFVIILVVLAASFYWFEFRTMQARIACAKIAQDIKFSEQQQAKGETDIRLLNENMRNEYTFCLHGKGL